MLDLRKPSMGTDEADFEASAARFGEWLRRVALGLLAALVTARAYWPSEIEPSKVSGSGLVWVLAILVVAGLGVAATLIGGRFRFRWSWTDVAVVALMFLVGLSSVQGLERRLAINLAWEWAGLGFAYVLARNLPRTRGESTVLAGALAGDGGRRLGLWALPISSRDPPASGPLPPRPAAGAARGQLACRSRSRSRPSRTGSAATRSLRPSAWQTRWPVSWLARWCSVWGWSSRTWPIARPRGRGGECSGWRHPPALPALVPDPDQELQRLDRPPCRHGGPGVAGAAARASPTALGSRAGRRGSGRRAGGRRSCHRPA